MKTDRLHKHLRELKKELAGQGFVIDALCGSFARAEETQDSDLDLLYHVEESFLEKHGGFSAFKELDRIKKYLQQRLEREVDLIPSNNLSQTARQYIVQECIDVR